MDLRNHILLAAIILFILLLGGVFLLRRLRRGSQHDDHDLQIYIGNLPYRTNEEDLQEHFSKYGPIDDVRVVKDRRSGRSKGYAFLTFSNARAAKKSLAAQGKELGGRSLVVHIAKPR
jgi:RNA recognition motif-containing protein